MSDESLTGDKGMDLVIGLIILAAIVGFLFIVGSNYKESPELRRMNEQSRQRIESEQGLEGPSYFDQHKWEDGKVKER